MALAAQRLGGDVSLIARVGEDAFAEEALALLRESGANVSGVKALPGVPTGVALIAVSEAGENQIIVASGANSELLPHDLPDLKSDAVLCVLEIPVETVAAAAQKTTSFFAVNLAPAVPVPETILQRADLIIVNEGEAAFYGDRLHGTKGLVAVTYGADGAVLYRNGAAIAEAVPPEVIVIDTTRCRGHVLRRAHARLM